MVIIQDFPKTWEEYESQWKITDKEQIYSNGIDFIPCFRVRQWLENIKSRPKGKWKIEVGSIPQCCECSICGWVISAGDNEENNYCPHCGADMRETETWQRTAKNDNSKNGE